MNAAARFRHEAGEVLGDEIEHLKSFGWSDSRVAERLGITVNAIEQRRLRAAKSVATSGDSQ
jgi:plasmid maintenance system antidote protein VapI